MAEPVSLEDIKAHLRLDPDETGEDIYLQALIVAARRACEAQINRSITPVETVRTLERFPANFNRHDGFWQDDRLFVPELVAAIIGITYRVSGVETPLDPASYVADLTYAPARIAPVTAWPSSDHKPGAVTIRYMPAAFGDDDLTMIAHAVRLLVGNWYANREGAVVDTRGTPAELPLAVKWLLDPLRVVATA